VLADRGGGALGVTGLARVVVGAVEPESARSGLGGLGGAMVEVVKADRDGIQRLELGVRSPGDAAERLTAVDLQGLDIRAAG
jgi:hypothetical protein